MFLPMQTGMFAPPLKAKELMRRIPPALLTALMILTALRAEDAAFPLLNQIQERHVAIQQQAAAAVVEVQSFGARIDTDKPCYGTGVVISAEGLILSSNTCVPSSADSVQVTFSDGRVLKANLIDYDPSTEVRLLRITPQAGTRKPFPFLELADSSKARVGELAYSAGNPFHTISRDGQVAWSVGTVSGIYNLTKNADDFAHYRGVVLETDAAVNPGSDGGPLIDANGRLLGLLSLSYCESRWLGTAIPSHLLKKALERQLQNVPLVDPAAPGMADTATNAKNARGVADGLSVASRPAQSAMVKLLVKRVEGAAPAKPAAPKPARAQLPNPGLRRPDTPVSGVLFDPQGFILTSAFNVEGNDASDDVQITAILSNGARLPAKRRGRNYGQDVAVLQIEIPKDMVVPYIPLATDSELRLGRFITVLGASEDSAAPTRTMGVVSAVGRLDGGVVQTDALINYGNSGGAVIDLRGRLVGIASHLKLNSDWSQPNSGVGFFAQSDKILTYMDDLKMNLDIRSPLRAFSGVPALENSPDIQGIMVDKITPGSVAWLAKLRESDIIVAVDGMITPNAPTLVEVLKAHVPGDTLDVTFMRSGKPMHSKAVLPGK